MYAVLSRTSRAWGGDYEPQNILYIFKCAENFYDYNTPQFGITSSCWCRYKSQTLLWFNAGAADRQYNSTGGKYEWIAF